ncbi:MAG: tetratricopeptide repeat protein [Acidobacteria bacterium]|nr:MAG: tetratricopeptide repeat protein [Acidobacteriota bacterium]
MSHRLTRKDMKRDELREGLGAVVHFLSEYGRTIVAGIVALLVLVAIAAGYREYQQRREITATEDLAEALRIYQAPVLPSGATPPDTSEPTFSTEEARAARAREMFDEIRANHDGTDAADIAAVYRAELATREGDLAQARELWEGFLERQKDHMLAAEVQLNLMSLDRLEGRGEELITRLNSMLDSPDRNSLPTDVLLNQLAITLEDSGREEEARRTYRRIIDEFPSSPYVTGARARTES